MTEMTGILMEGKMSFGVPRMARTPAIKMKMAKTMKVYGLRSARLTIHIAYFPAPSFKSAYLMPSLPLATLAEVDSSRSWHPIHIRCLPQKDMFYEYRSFSRSPKCYTGINLIPFQY